MTNNKNQSYFIGVFLQTTPIVQKFTTVLIELIQLIHAYALPIVYFLVNHIYYHSVNTIYYHLLNYPYYTNHIQYNYIDITILLSYCNYIVTIIINTTYSYIYRYNISIKIYNNQYRYKHTDSIIRIILNNTEVNNHTVYTYHNYTIINTILVYSNFLPVYYSYLLSKQ